ncbi:MAG: pyruvate kinase [Pseudomonadota bacterium]
MTVTTIKKSHEPQQVRLTKIVVTLGPSLDDETMLRKVMVAGASVFRANFSHGSADDHAKRINAVRKIATELKTEVAILADLQGPKIRVSRFKQKKVELQDGQTFILDASLENDQGDETHVGIDYKELPHDVHVGDTLLLDDGKIVFTVKNVEGPRITCLVVNGGELSNNKGINRQGGGLSAPALTEKDCEDLKTALKLGADYIAVSFPRSAADIFEARILIKAAGGNAKIIAKIERAEAVPVIDEIIKASDGVMVARGDLAVEIGDAEVPAVQKLMIMRARALNKPVITATQMLESMITCPVPTRAEVSDVANAVLDATDAVMLSAETATGKFPDKAVETMVRIALTVEKNPAMGGAIHTHEVDPMVHHVDEAIARATMYTANHLNITAIIAMTESGSTPLWMSRVSAHIPIYALSRNIPTQRIVALYRGVYPVHFDATKVEKRDIIKEAVKTLQRLGLLKEGDRVILTKGDMAGIHGKTNTMKIVEVGSLDS